jgi:hypothetical protein
MATWSLELVLTAIEYVLNELPMGKYREFIWNSYACRDSNFNSLFAYGRHELTTWWNKLIDEEKLK